MYSFIDVYSLISGETLADLMNVYQIILKEAKQNS